MEFCNINSIFYDYSSLKFLSITITMQRNFASTSHKIYYFLNTKFQRGRVYHKKMQKKVPNKKPYKSISSYYSNETTKIDVDLCQNHTVLIHFLCIFLKVMIMIVETVKAPAQI